MKNLSGTSFLTLVLSCFGAAAVAQVTPMTYRDWSVTCNNVKTCMAYSVSSNSEGGLASRPRALSEDIPEGWITIERAAGPNAMTRISLSRPDLSSNNIPNDAQIHLLGSNGQVIPRGIFAATLGSRDVIEVAPSLNASFLSLARGANHALLVVGPAERKVFFVSLSGLVASGRAMDAHQGRTNTIGALIDIGRRSEATVPAARARPILIAHPFTKRPSARPPASVMAMRAAQCEDSERFDRGGTNIEAYNLDRGRILWSIPCGAGAYNTWNQLYIEAPRTTLTMARFSGKPVGDSEEAIGIVNASFDPAKGTVTGFSKARGLGDCGSDETYVWTGEVFALAELNEMVPCGGIVSDFWPSVITHSVRVRPTPR